MDEKAQANYFNKEFNGIILEIKYVEGNRGDPYVKIGDQWLVFGKNEAKVLIYIEISDSIAKESGTKKYLIKKC